jgi:predicted Zn-dependent peptidase
MRRLASHARACKNSLQTNMTTQTREIEKTILPNGMVVITEAMAHVRSVSVGIWIRSGSRREPVALNGISHFIEHMVFKGTERRTAEQIAREIDSIGGMVDAFTSKEMVCFNTRVLDEHLLRAFEVLSDLVLRPQFAEEEIAREQSVVLEEIKMTQDNPEDLVHEVMSQNFWQDHALGRPILGTPETVESFSAETLHTWFRRWYAPNNLVVTAAGNITHQQIVDLVAASFSHLQPVNDGLTETTPAARPHLTTCMRRELEQVHICIGVNALPISDPRRFAMSVLNNLLGSGMSSRLFQNIRERQGLAYAVFSEMNPYRDAGLLSVYAGTAQNTAEKLVRSVITEFQNLTENAVTSEELRRAKDHLKGAMLLSLESSGARMSNLARQHLYFDHFYSPDELIALLESVTAEEVLALARELFRSGEIAATAVGNLQDIHITADHLAFQDRHVPVA